MRWWMIAVAGGCSFSPGQLAVSRDAVVVDDGGGLDSDTGIPTSWWDTNFARRRPIVVTASSQPTPANYAVSFDVDTATLIANGDVLDSGADWRVVRWTGSSWQQLDRWIDDVEGPWATAATRTWFQLPVALSAGASDASTWLYYDAPTAGLPAATMSNVFIVGDDFEQPHPWVANGRGETVSVDTSTPRGGTAALRIVAGSTSAGGVHLDIDLPHEPLVFTHYLRQEQTGDSFGHLRAFSTVFAGRAPGWIESAVALFLEIDSSNNLQSIAAGTTVTNWASGYGSDVWRRIDVAHDPVTGSVRARLDMGTWTAAMNDYATSDATPALRSLALEGEGQGGTFQIDNYIVRRYVDPEPVASLGAEELVPR